MKEVKEKIHVGNGLCVYCGPFLRFLNLLYFLKLSLARNTHSTLPTGVSI